MENSKAYFLPTDSALISNMNNLIDKRILSLIREHYIFTLAVTREAQPWCATCFYIYDEETQSFCFYF